MSKRNITSNFFNCLGLTLLGAFTLWLLVLASPALAGPPTHPRAAGLDIEGFNHACGAAVDSEGDVYVASTGESKVRVFDPVHKELASIANPSEPCALAVNSKGDLFVSEQATGNVVRYKPNAYPFAGTPTYGAAEAIDSSGKAKGIAVDPFDDRLYVTQGTRIATYSAEGTPGISEMQRVVVNSFASEPLTGGTYTLTFKGTTASPIPGQTTEGIKFDAGPAELEKALLGLAAIEPGDVSVEVDTSPSGEGFKNLVTFTGAFASQDVELLKFDGSNLIPASNGGSVSTQVDAWEGIIAEGKLTEATGVAAYTYRVSSEKADRYLFVADAATDTVESFGGTDVRTLKLRETLKGPKAGEDFGFGPEGAYLAVDAGNADEAGKCVSVDDQACTAGHLLVYDASRKALDEFEASGELLDQLKDPAFDDAKPTAMAIDRSGGLNDGTIYVTSGDGPDSELLAFGPLAAPSRAPMPELSQVLTKALSVAVDSKGYVYAATPTLIHVYDPSGKEVEVGPLGEGIEDPNRPTDLAVDSSGVVYVVDDGSNSSGDETATYFTPSAYPPVNGTTYARHEPPLVTEASLGAQPEQIAVDLRNDHLLVTGNSNSKPATIELDAAANKSKLIRKIDFDFGTHPQSIDVCATTGSIYVGEQNTDRISVINSGGTERLAWINGTGGPNGPFPVQVPSTVDQSNCHVLAFENSMGAAREYDASGAFVAEFSFPEPQGFTKELFQSEDIAIDNSGGPNDGVAYVAFDDTKPDTPDLWAFAPLAYGEAPLATTGIAGGLGSGEATLNGTVNPRGFELTDCRFEYLTDAEYEQNLDDEDPAFAEAQEADCTESLASIGKGSLPVPVHAEIAGLDPEGRYRFRLMAENKYGPSFGDAGLLGPPLIETKGAVPVLYDEATLRAGIDPSGLATEYRFQYGPSEAYGQSTPVEELEPGDQPIDIAAPITGLAEGTTYHFRVVAENEAKTVFGPDQLFTTQERSPEQHCPNTEYRTGLSSQLPDCRAYELVTPAETNGLSPFAPIIDSAGSTAVGFSNWMVTPRGPLAGERLAFFTLGTLPGFEGNGNLDGYRARRSPGAHPPEGWSSELLAPSYPQATPDVLNPVSQQSFSSDQLYSFWQVRPTESFPETLEAGIYLRTPAGFEPVGQGTLGTDLSAQGRYVSSGGVHVIFGSDAQLEEGAPSPGTLAIYDRAAGSNSAEVLSLLPGNSIPAKDAVYVGATEDGEAVLFEVTGVLYLRRGGETVEVAAVPNAFAGISEDGERVFYEREGSTFHFESSTQQSGEIAGESSFVNVAPGGSGALFTSKVDLTAEEANEAGEEAEAGERNLYAWDAGTDTTDFVAQLDPQDFTGFEGNESLTLSNWTRVAVKSGGPELGRSGSPTRSTPDGEAFLFQSHAQLTASDNEGRGEIYRYEPTAAMGERLLCISCHPGGVPPGGDAMLVTRVHETTLVPNLTDDGQAAFFESPDRLLPEDANAVTDVYEWKAKGQGDCKRAAGCLALISSGQGEADSNLYSMSADGHDVFFRTTEKLVAQDVPGSSSIYDARVQGGIPDPPIPAPCQGDACQGQGTPPPPLPAPASIASGGDDKVSPQRPRPRCPKGKRKARVKGKVRCVKRPARQRGPAKAKRGASR